MRKLALAMPLVPITEPARLDSVLRGVLRTLLYFDIFDFPLTAKELFYYHPDPDLDFSRLAETLTGPAAADLFDTERGFYFLKGRDHLVEERLLAEIKAQPLFAMARTAMQRIKRLPFVRGIYLSGDLSKGVAGDTSDLDFFIITAGHRVWLCKLVLALFRRVPRWNPHKLLCFNYLLDERTLELRPKNEFAAFETAGLYPLYNKELLLRFFAQNEWIRSRLPRYDQVCGHLQATSYDRSTPARVLEFMLGGPLGHALNLLLKNMWRTYWRVRYWADGQTRFRLLAGSQAPFSKSHGHPTEQIILQEYRRRLHTWHLAEEDGVGQDADNRYFEKVAAYYDKESERFEQHYHNNAILQRLRQDFRRMTERYAFRSCLEIGCGPGLDLLYYAKKYPDRCVRGIDVSPGMWQQACTNLQQLPAADVRADIGTPDDLDALYPGQRFDLMYCYFGALNTVPDLEAVAVRLRNHLTDQGVLVLTFVNRWYVFDILWNIFRMRFRQSVARLRPLWTGYAPNRTLDSRCRSAHEINKAFAPLFTMKERRGYSIVFPAWFRHRFIDTEGRLGHVLWHIDRLLNKTPLWNCGEYSLYVFKPR